LGGRRVNLEDEKGVSRMAQQEEFLLKWNDHHASFFNIVEDLCRTEQLCDVTLACGGQVFETHRLILSVCSPYFRTMLNRVDKHPIIYLKDVNPQHLEQLLSYMYRGEINVLQDDLGPLIETARGLQIKGLADAGGTDKKEQVHNQKSVLKRPRTTTPTPSLPKILKVDKPKKALVSSNLVSGEVSSAPLLPASVPRAPEEGEESGVVKLENEEGWGEDNSIPNEAYEVNLPKNYEQELVKSYEADLQMEDEQYIQPDGLTGQQIMMLQKEIQKKYSCEFCHKRFPTPSKLNRHRLVHSGEKPYNCVICNKGFTQKVHLNTHKKLAHSDVPGFGDEVGGLYGGESIGFEKVDEDHQITYAGSDSENSLFIHTEASENEGVEMI